jgi:hypothetical protein
MTRHGWPFPGSHVARTVQAQDPSAKRTALDKVVNFPIGGEI